MTPRWTQIGLGAALLAGAVAGLPAAAQHHPPGHRAAAQHARGVDQKTLTRLLSGLSAAEKQFVQRHLAAMPPEHRPMMVTHMLKMPAAQRRNMVQQMLKGGGIGGHTMHGPGGGHGHAGHDANGSPHGAPGHPDPHTSHPKGGRVEKPRVLAVGDQVPDFTVRDLQGKTHTLRDLRRRTKSGIVSLTFWCSFCHSCRDVEARLDRVARERKGEAVVAAIDASAGETDADVTAFARKKSLTLPILIDAPGTSADLFGVGVTTTTVIIDGSGVLRYRGRFADSTRPLAEEALAAVLDGKEVAPKETALQG
jgi:peroxiredoxin